MPIRRCAVLLLEPRESLEFDLSLLLQGGSGLRTTLEWIALAPHLGAEVVVDAAERELLGSVGETQWVDRDAVEGEHSPATIDALLEKGLLISDEEAEGGYRERDDKVRNAYWKPLTAVAHYFTRWDGVTAGEEARQSGLRTNADLVERYGAAPPHFHECGPAQARITLPHAVPGAIDALLSRRATCRNFDRGRTVGAETFSALLRTVFGALAVMELAPMSSAVKKNSPSGGGLHATEAYLLIQRVEGVAPGLYHYHSGAHALEPVGAGERDGAALQALALRFVAGQEWFADAHVQVVLAPRFRRSFWKYRSHAKAYRALILDAGHLSQTLYLAATEHGLGAFITAAINEAEIERALGLDPLEESPIAVCGFGWRGSERATVEFDPLKRVWKD
jgi:putative peptide maturation dehydrogenase